MILDKRLLKNLDFTLLFVVIAILAYGCAMIYSASRGGSTAAGYVERQLVWAVIGTIIAIAVASIDTSVYNKIAGKLYGSIVFLLIAVLVMGHSSKGAQRWIGVGSLQIQPSEFAKIIMIIALSVFLVKRSEDIRSFKLFFNSFLYLSLPMLLIFKQPDLGTSLALLAIWIFTLFIMGTNIKNILIFIGAGMLLALIVWNTPGVLKDYQKKRVITFINPAADPLGSGYHVTQSRIAIGSGKMSGKGFLKGTQRELRFIPEQHTDFIFTVVGEEMGFIGAVVLLLLYFALLWRGLCIMSATEDPVGRGIAAGVVGMFIFHLFVNMGMTLGIMPVTGVPLPMFSYGGSSLMSNLISIGLLQGVSMRRHRITF